MNNNISDGRWWVTFPTCRERENHDDEPNYEDILRCLDRWTMDRLRDGDILDEWTNGERGDTTFPVNFRPMQDQLTMALVVTLPRR